MRATYSRIDAPAVYGMKMTIGDRVIVASIKERAQAQAEYDAAKDAGKTASLLEEDRPNVFTMNVANILPKDRIQVELVHRAARADRRVYEMVYPTVVGPRYVGEHATNSDFAHRRTRTRATHRARRSTSTSRSGQACRSRRSTRRRTRSRPGSRPITRARSSISTRARVRTRATATSCCTTRSRGKISHRA